MISQSVRAVKRNNKRVFKISPKNGFSLLLYRKCVCCTCFKFKRSYFQWNGPSFLQTISAWQLLVNRVYKMERSCFSQVTITQAVEIESPCFQSVILHCKEVSGEVSRSSENASTRKKSLRKDKDDGDMSFLTVNVSKYFMLRHSGVIKSHGSKKHSVDERSLKVRGKNVKTRENYRTTPSNDAMGQKCMYDRPVQTHGSVLDDCRPQHFPKTITCETEMRQLCSRARSIFSPWDTRISKSSGHPPLSSAFHCPTRHWRRDSFKNCVMWRSSKIHDNLLLSQTRIIFKFIPLNSCELRWLENGAAMKTHRTFPAVISWNKRRKQRWHVRHLSHYLERTAKSVRYARLPSENRKSARGSLIRTGSRDQSGRDSRRHPLNGRLQLWEV